MGIFDKLFSKKPSDGRQKAENEPSKDPNMIKVFDGYGRELYITKQEWKDKILIGNLEKVRNNPDELYSMLVSAINDGFSKDVVKYAEILHRIDRIPSRGATVLGIVYMDCNRLEDSAEVLTNCIKKNGEEGYVLTNLAKVYSRQGNNEYAESILWHALEIDPNQENGLGWYASIQNERGGEPASLEAYRKVAKLSKSWRAQMWLARSALGKNDIGTAKKLYEESISRAGKPIPADLLMQMSGDLGNSGYLNEIIQFVEPNFDPAYHGILVGNNLIKAYFDLDQLVHARTILDNLYSQRRPDWRETLSFWDTELAKKKILDKSKEPSDIPAISIVSIEGPLWCRDQSPFAALLPRKTDTSIKIAIFGNTNIQHFPSNEARLQLTDSPGRASRAIPLFLAEKIHLSTNATGFALITWAQTQGFAVFGTPHDEQTICELAEKGGISPDIILSVMLNTINPEWEVSVDAIHRLSRTSIGKIITKVVPENPGPTILQLGNDVTEVLVNRAGVNVIPTPEWYVMPDEIASSNYLLRLEQQLAVACENLDFLQGGALQGEHEIIDGILQLSAGAPTNKTFRMIFSETLRQMKKLHPNVVAEFREKVILLQKEHPLDGHVGQLIHDQILGLF